MVKAREPYRVSIYINGGQELIFDGEYAAKALAVSAFHKGAAANIADKGACVLLSRGRTTLASKSTNATWVEINRAFYG